MVKYQSHIGCTFGYKLACVDEQIYGLASLFSHT